MTHSDTAEVAVITPTRLRAERVPYLLELYASLQKQGVPFQWVLALDGVPLSELPAVLREDPRVVAVPLPRAVGAGAARNFALNEVTTAWCTTADDDDLLPEGSLSLRLEHARANGLGWCAGWSADLHPDGSTTTWHCPTPPGFHEAGAVWRFWKTPDSTIPIGPTTLLARTDLIRGSGGYAALPQGEDYAYLVGITGGAPGALLPAVVYHYRKHPEQMTAHPSYPAMESRARVFAWRHGQHLAALREAFKETVKSA
ncbi:glycosyltransferase [Streptomyces sp. RM72]|uniref:glycosyltransferase family 2 protein n=1 Tax=Streptomyces sp. RM72 TaxID=1115510 RepID=UPI0027E22F63|nr:glycosyltransferase [Streptomyces sp. RM72]